MEKLDYIAIAKSHFKGTVAPDETPPSPDDLPRVSVRETVQVHFTSEDQKRHVVVLLDRTTGHFVSGAAFTHEPG